MKGRRSVRLWVLVLWVLGLGTAGVWRGIVLWRERALLFGLGSSLSPMTLGLFVGLFWLCGGGLTASAVGLWLGHDWARHAARACVPLKAAIDQLYLWCFVRSGLMWERRWVSLALAIGSAVTALGVLTWHRSRQWLGLQMRNPSKDSL